MFRQLLPNEKVIPDENVRKKCRGM